MPEESTAVAIIDRALDELAQRIGEMHGDPSREQILERIKSARETHEEPALYP